VALYNISNAVDRDPEMLIAGIHEQQRMMINSAERQLSRWESYGDRDARYRREGEAKRKPAEQAGQARKGSFIPLL
jgi:hypothetical protein